MSGLSRRTALRPRGKRAARWAKWQDSQRRAVLARDRYTCQSCGKRDPFVQPDWHHLMGRGAHVAEPWASSAALTVALCRECHSDLHDGRMTPERFRVLLWEAMTRLVEAVASAGAPVLVDTTDPFGALHSLIRVVEDRRLSPPSYIPAPGEENS